MAKEILLYTSINSYSVSDFINQLEANKDNDIVVRMNTPGGSVYDGYGAIAKFNEHKGGKKIKVDGRADSFGAFQLCFANTEDVECLDVSTFTYHRAAMAPWYEADAKYFTDEIKAQLNEMNDVLRAGIESKTTAAKWKSVTGVSLDDMFALTSRIDVRIDAAKAKKLGLVGKVNKITPDKLAEIKAYSADLAAEITALTPEANNEPLNTDKMNINEVKANAEVYNAIKAEILAEEKERIEAFAAWKEVDPAAVMTAIVEGAKYTASFGAKMQVKALTVKGAGNIEGEQAGAIVPVDATAQKTAEQKKGDDFSATVTNDVLERFGVKPAAKA